MFSEPWKVLISSLVAVWVEEDFILHLEQEALQQKEMVENDEDRKAA